MTHFLATILFSIFSLSIIFSQTYVDKEGNKQLWGIVSLDEFSNEPFSNWYTKNAKDFLPTILENDKDLFNDISVKVFIGSWCGDTKYLFPKFMKYWDKLGLPENQLEIIALHHEDDLYKQGPNGESKGLDIHRVPTLVFYNEEKEIGRIVERVVFDLETDLKLIAGQLPYKHRYQAIPIVSELMKNNIDSLDSETLLKSAIKKTEREVLTAQELNIYGYVLFFAGELEKSKFVFKLNKELFPYNPYTSYSNGRILNELNDPENAKMEFLEAIRIKPDLDRAIEFLFEINESIKEVNK